MSQKKQVQKRYAAGAQAVEPTLCCPVNYDPKYLKIIPQAVLDRDYGCGDPSRYVRSGETVLDLGSGGGKICFIASQIVGVKGRVIGVDMTDEMLDLARNSRAEVAEKIGYDNIEFKKGHIEDLALDLDLLEAYLAKNPVKNSADYEKLEVERLRVREKNPMIADDSVDVIVSNCVLNLVADHQKKQLFEEMYRVLKKGGRVAISDIVSDEVSPENLKKDDKLWSGCISGALTESDFVRQLEAVGFHGITIDKFESKPWQVVEGIEYRSVTVLAYKGKEGPCYEKNQAVIYKGPWKRVEDDDGHVFFRGKRMAVCEKTFGLMGCEPYSDFMIRVDSGKPVSGLVSFDCEGSKIRLPEETKSGVPRITTDADQGGGSCC